MSGLRVRVRTRSKVLDYRFVAPEQPRDRWWETGYGRWTDFARPTILAEPRNFFVSGISSGRTDSRGARIHYALLGEVDSEGCELAGKVLAYLCELLGRTGSLDEAGARLDALSEDNWTAALHDDPAAVSQVDRGLMDVLLEWAGHAKSGPTSDQFLLSAAEPQAFARLAGAAAGVVTLEKGRPERALYLNLASSSELAQLEQQGSGIVCREVDRDPKPQRRLPASMALVAGGIVCLVILLVWLASS